LIAQELQDKSENSDSIVSSFRDGITTSVDLPIDYFSNIGGGINYEDSYMLNAILAMCIDLESFFGLNGTSVYISILGIEGEPFLENTGAIQGISNIAGITHWKPYEAWVEQNLFNNDLSILIGLYDLNTEFDTRESSIIFINPSFGIGFDFSQSGLNGPSIFPYTSLAIRIKARLSDSMEIIGAMFDGVPGSLEHESSFRVNLSQEEGSLIATELIYSSPNDQTRLSIGCWYYTSRFETLLHASRENGNFGIYLNAEKLIYSEEGISPKDVTLFGRIGLAHNSFNPSDYSILGGINYSGLIPGRDKDIFGVAFTSIHLSSEFKTIRTLNSNFETIFELTYSIQISDWLRLQPDLQYILNPVLAPRADYAFVAGIRTEISF
jgi:porin